MTKPKPSHKGSFLALLLILAVSALTLFGLLVTHDAMFAVFGGFAIFAILATRSRRSSR